MNLANYDLVSAFCRETTTQGGSLIFVRKNIKAKERCDVSKLTVELKIEISCVELEKHIVVCVYRPPKNNNFLVFESTLENVLKIISKSNKSLVVCGDFNTDLLEETSFKNRLLCLFRSFNLSNIFEEPTRITATTATCIDNIYCNCDITNKEIFHCLPSDHTGQSALFPCCIDREKITILKRHINSHQIERYKAALNHKLSIQNYNLSIPNESYQTLFSVITEEFEDKFKLRKIKIDPKFKFSDWATRGIRKSRQRLFELYDEKTYNTSLLFKDYVRNYSKIFKNVCLEAKANFIRNKIHCAENKIKTVWKVINSETGKTKNHDSGLVLKTAQGLITSEGEVAQEFENYFANIPLKTTEALNSSPSLAADLLEANVKLCDAVFEFREINSHTIIKAFKDLKLKETEDLWGMSVKFCKSIIHDIAPYLAEIFNSCVREGVFPDLMKLSKIVPLFKAGEKQDPGNFRPVSILPVLSKIFEKILLNQMLSHFNTHSLLHNQQYGFTKGRSTTDAGESLLRHIYSAWNESQDAIGVFCDLSKAFDCVHHETLISKLNHYGVRDNALKLLKSYLSNRIQKVQIKSTQSQGCQVEIGVPQGSILGPFLFLVYINDLPFMVQNLAKIVLFADDTSLIFKVNRQTQNVDDVNNALLRIQDWFTVNNLVLNSKKTKCIRFSLPNVQKSKLDIVLNNDVLDFVDNAVFLGITLDEKLQWDPHINALSKRLSSAAYAVRKIRLLTDVETARIVYFSYFHSIMSYGILLWGQAASIMSIFVLQKRAIRAIYKLRCRDSLRELFKKINILTVPCQYIFENIMLARKNVSLYLKNSDVHNYNTRNKNKIVQPNFRIAKINKCFMGNCIRYYNKIPDDIQNLSDRQFKCKIKDTLCKKAYYRTQDYLNDKDCWHV